MAAVLKSLDALCAEGAPFESEVADLAARLGDRGQGKWLIADADARAIAMALLAVLHRGGTPVFPANMQSGHLRRLAEGMDGVLTSDAALEKDMGALPVFAPVVDAAGRASLPQFDGGAASVILHTSGTSGEPLAIEKPLDCLEAEVQALEQAFGDRIPVAGGIEGTVPPYHIYGLLFRVLWPLASGRRIAGGTMLYPEELQGRTPAVLVSSPAFLKRVVGVLDLGVLNANGTLVVSSGGPLPPEVAAQYNAALRNPIVEVYGSTETGGIAWRSVSDAVAPPAWRCLSGVSVEIEGDDGLLAVTSPFIPGGRLLTGDRAGLSAEGGFELLGRADRIVKVEELRVSLTEMEARLEVLPEVQAARAVALDEPSGRQVLGAVVVPSDAGWDVLAEGGKQALVSRLRNALRTEFSAVALPRRWRVVGALPEDERGKTTQAALRMMFLADAGRNLTPLVLEKAVTAEKAILRLKMPGDLTVFEGHFDGAPVLPGVAQVAMAVAFARDILGLQEDALRRLEALKFFKVIRPDQEVTLDLAWDASKGRLTFLYHDAGQRYSTGRLAPENIQ